MSMDSTAHFDEDRYNLHEALEDVEGVAATLVALTTYSRDDGAFGDAVRYLTCQLIGHHRSATEALGGMVERPQ
jgi:hypothetical protein